jgi:acyl-CoA thioesterase FadM
VAAINRRTMRYTCLMTRGDTRIASGSTTIACVSKPRGEPMKAIDIPPDVAARFTVAPDAEA